MTDNFKTFKLFKIIWRRLLAHLNSDKLPKFEKKVLTLPVSYLFIQAQCVSFIQAQCVSFIQAQCVSSLLAMRLH